MLFRSNLNGKIPEVDGNDPYLTSQHNQLSRGKFENICRFIASASGSVGVSTSMWKTIEELETEKISLMSFRVQQESAPQAEDHRNHTLTELRLENNQLEARVQATERKLKLLSQKNTVSSTSHRTLEESLWEKKTHPSL